MRSFGLTNEELKEIKKLFQKHFGDLSDAKVYLSGSRAKGEHKKYSDVDLAIKTKSKDVSKRIAFFQEDWELTKIPYKVDITSWKDIFKPYLPDIRRTKKSQRSMSKWCQRSVNKVYLIYTKSDLKI